MELLGQGEGRFISAKGRALVKDKDQCTKHTQNWKGLLDVKDFLRKVVSTELVASHLF